MQPRSTNGIKTTTSNKIRAVNTRRPKYHHALSSKEAIILRLRRRLQSVNSKTNSQFQSKHKSFYTDAMMWITITENWKQPGCEFLASKARFIRHQARVCNFCRRRHWIIIPTSYNHFTLIYPHILISSFWRPGLRAACSTPVPVCARQPASDQATTGFQVTFFLLTPPLTLLASLLSSRTGWIAINTAAKAIRPEGPIIWGLPSIILLPFFLPPPSRISNQSAT